MTGFKSAFLFTIMFLSPLSDTSFSNTLSLPMLSLNSLNRVFCRIQLCNFVLFLWFFKTGFLKFGSKMFNFAILWFPWDLQVFNQIIFSLFRYLFSNLFSRHTAIILAPGGQGKITNKWRVVRVGKIWVGHWLEMFEIKLGDLSSCHKFLHTVKNSTVPCPERLHFKAAFDSILRLEGHSARRRAGEQYPLSSSTREAQQEGSLYIYWSELRCMGHMGILRSY